MKQDENGKGEQRDRDRIGRRLIFQKGIAVQMKNGHPINPRWSRASMDRKISVADRNLRDPRYCCWLVSRREILTSAVCQPPLCHPSILGSSAASPV